MKTITVNLCVTLLLLMGVNAVAALLYDAKTLLKSSVDPAEQISQKIDQQYALAPYKDKTAGYQILSEVDHMGTDYKSFVGWSRKPYRGKTTTVDEAGDRQHSGASLTPTDTIRLFGGSAMWGRGAADQGTIPALLNRAFPDHQVFNHGEAGFTSRQALARLINIANQAEDLGTVVFYDGVNDIYTHCWTKGGINTHAREGYIRGRLDGDAENETLLQKLENTSLGPIFLTETYKLLLSVKEYLAPNKGRVKQTIKSRSRCQNDPRYARRVAMTLIENWKLAKSIVEARGGRFIAVLQPVIYMGRPVTEHVRNPKDLPRLEGDYKSVYPIIRSELRKMSASWVSDFTDVFDVEEPLYIDFCHVTTNGNALVVKRLASFMQPSVDISLKAVSIKAVSISETSQN